MANTSPARALQVVTQLVEMCDLFEHPEVVVVIEQKIVPVSMPRTVAGFGQSSGLGLARGGWPLGSARRLRRDSGSKETEVPDPQ